MKALALLVGKDEEGRVVLKAPAVGQWVGAPSPGALAQAGHGFGALSILGRSYPLQVPVEARGIVLEILAGPYVEYGQVLAVLGEASSAPSEQAAVSGEESTGALVFRSTSSGRFYLRPAPDKPPFVSVGDEIETGHILFLLEVMKTFSRIPYEGQGLPERARVRRILPCDGDDLEANQVVFELEPV